MEAFWATIISAFILGPLVVVFQRFRKENTEQHAESRDLLQQVIKTVNKVDDRLEGHIDWHLTKEITEKE
jgi:RNAse (barnase) inhibitor barstar